MTITQVKNIYIVFLRRLKRAFHRPDTALQFFEKVFRIIRTGQAMAVIKRHSGSESLDRDYDRWVKLYDSEHPTLCECPDTTVFTILLLIPAGHAAECAKAIQSIRAQLFAGWEVFVIGDAECLEGLKRSPHDFAQEERIKIYDLALFESVYSGLNTLLLEAKGDFVLMMRAADEIVPHALCYMAEELSSSPDASVIYSDEDRLDDKGKRCHPNFKPDWNPLLLLSQNYFGHLVAYSRLLVLKIGAFHELPLEIMEWDLALRATAGCEAKDIKHIAKILCHTGPSLLDDQNLPATQLAELQKSVLIGHFTRIGQSVKFLELDDGRVRVNYCLPHPAPLVTIIIPTRDNLAFLTKCIQSVLEKTTYPHYEIIVVDNQSQESKTLAYLDELRARSQVKVLSYDAPFNYSAINNFAVKHATGELIALVNDDIEVISPDWLEEMAGYAIQKEVGAVGAMLYYPDDTIQHAGMILGIYGVAGHRFSSRIRGDGGYQNRALLPQNLSAVTAACLVLRREIYHEVAGMDEALPVACNDVDLCLRLLQRGYRNVWTPFAELYHHESSSRGYEDSRANQERFSREKTLMQHRWGNALSYDPAYNLNFSLDSTLSLAFPPRRIPPDQSTFS